MVDKVEINQEQENNPTLEEQAKQQEEKQEAPQQVTSNEERPSWLPDKFSNAEELAKAYGALETKLSQRQEVKQEEKTDMKIQEPQEPESKPGQFDKYYDEFAKEGKLTETSYGELQKLGLDRQVVDAYIDGQTALADQRTNSIMSTVGGKEQYNEMIDWASKNLSSDEIKAFNSTIDTGTLEQAQLAIAGVQAKYSSNNAEPNLFSGNNADSNVGYRSVGEMLRDINDPRYSTDSAFRQDVENKVKLSNAI
jgi:hypothetical protein|tara:strand:- start:361 stop:1116 length:756 start_codon:yes stop_codon:yes gene_type:complete